MSIRMIHRVRRVLIVERGAAYSVGLVMTIPVILISLCLMVEAAMILECKLAVSYASHCAARVYVVWGGTHPDSPDLVAEKTRQAAIQALTPFASSHPMHRFDTTPPPESAALVAAYESSGGADTKGGKLLAAKFTYAAQPEVVTVKIDGRKLGDRAVGLKKLQPLSQVRVTVRYEFPFTVPVIGRVLGHPAPTKEPKFRTYTIASTTTMPFEGFLGDGGKLGIDYAPH
ncbi:MAG: hypothetical protein AB7I30_21110 [Isosphaeraceae bacterium]